VGAVVASLVSWTATVKVTLAPLEKVRVTGTDWDGNRSVVKPVRVTDGPSSPIPICTEPRLGSWIGVPVSDAPGELLAEADGEAPAELDPAAAEAPEPALNWLPPATGEATETSLSALAPRFTITIRSCAVEPLA